MLSMEMSALAVGGGCGWAVGWGHQASLCIAVIGKVSANSEEHLGGSPKLCSSPGVCPSPRLCDSKTVQLGNL